MPLGKTNGNELHHSFHHLREHADFRRRSIYILRVEKDWNINDKIRELPARQWKRRMLFDSV